MPKTPPLILPNSFPNWFNTPADEHGDKPTTATIEKRSEEIQHILEADISSFTYTPSDEDDDDDDEDDTISDLGRSKFSQGSNRSHKSNHSNTVVRDVNNLYHKPSSSNKSSQQRHRSVTPVVVNENSSEQYQLEDDDMDDILESQQHHPSTDQQQNVHNERECPATDTQNAMEDDTFYVAIDRTYYLFILYMYVETPY